MALSWKYIIFPSMLKLVSHSPKYTKCDGQMRKEETGSREERGNVGKYKLGYGGWGQFWQAFWEQEAHTGLVQDYVLIQS